MKTKNEIFHQTCGNLEAVDGVMHDLRERRYNLLDELCEIMNDIFVSEIKDLGFRDAHFRIDDFECESELLLLFEENESRKDFATEEKWIDYHAKNIGICYEYFENRCLDLDITCLSREEYDS